MIIGILLCVTNICDLTRKMYMLWKSHISTYQLSAQKKKGGGRLYVDGQKDFRLKFMIFIGGEGRERQEK